MSLRHPVMTCTFTHPWCVVTMCECSVAECVQWQKVWQRECAVAVERVSWRHVCLRMHVYAHVCAALCLSQHHNSRCACVRESMREGAYVCLQTHTILRKGAHVCLQSHTNLRKGAYVCLHSCTPFCVRVRMCVSNRTPFQYSHISASSSLTQASCKCMKGGSFSQTVWLFS